MEELVDNNIVTLTDENGSEVDFDLIMVFNYEGKRYAAMTPLDDSVDIEDDEVLILEVTEDGDDMLFSGIENEVLLDEIFAAFNELYEAELDAADAEDDKD